MDHYKLFIDGEFVEAKDGKSFETMTPGKDRLSQRSLRQERPMPKRPLLRHEDLLTAGCGAV